MQPPSDWNALPERLFASHACQDANRGDALLRLLPDPVKPVIWPREEADPPKAVSDGIVEETLACQSLICLEGGGSENSSVGLARSGQAA